MSSTYQVLSMVTTIHGLQKGKLPLMLLLLLCTSCWSYPKPYVAF